MGTKTKSYLIRGTDPRRNVERLGRRLDAIPRTQPRWEQSGEDFQDVAIGRAAAIVEDAIDGRVQFVCDGRRQEAFTLVARMVDGAKQEVCVAARRQQRERVVGGSFGNCEVYRGWRFRPAGQQGRATWATFNAGI